MRDARGSREERKREMIGQRVKALKEYRWSSYRYYAGCMRSPQWMTTETILAFFAGDSERARRGAYGRELEEAAGLGKPWDTDCKEAHGSGARAAALYVSRHYSDHSLRELGQLVGGVEYPAVTMAIRRFEKRLQVDKKLANRLNHVLKMLQVKT